MDIFSVGTYIKGQNSDATAIVRIETLTSTTGYLWVNEIDEGPDASDLPNLRNFDTNSGTWGPETIQEVGSGNETTVSEDVAVADTTISVVNTDFFPINRYIVIGSEKMRVVSKTRTELTVARAQDGTVATTHSTGINVAVVNGQGTFTSDIYYVSVDLENHRNLLLPARSKMVKNKQLMLIL